MVKKYMDENNKRPSLKDNKVISKWICWQLDYYRNKQYIMKNIEIYKEWGYFINDVKYKKYFTSYEEQWEININNVKKYIDKNKKKPNLNNKDSDIKKLAMWLKNQIKLYKKKENIMENKEIYHKFTEFINDDKYKNYFLSNQEEWYDNLNNVKKYIDENNKLPSLTDKDNDIKKIKQWINDQIKNNCKKEKIMKKYENIYKTWDEFINNQQYKKYFISNNEQWKQNLNKVKKYIGENNKKPSSLDKNKEIKKLSSWIYTQLQQYKKKKYNEIG